MRITLILLILLCITATLKAQARIGYTSPEIINEFGTKHEIIQSNEMGFPILTVKFGRANVIYFLNKETYICFVTMIQPNDTIYTMELIKYYDKNCVKYNDSTWFEFTKDFNFLIQHQLFSNYGKTFVIKKFEE